MILLLPFTPFRLTKGFVGALSFGVAGGAGGTCVKLPCCASYSPGLQQSAKGQKVLGVSLLAGGGVSEQPKNT